MGQLLDMALYSCPNKSLLPIHRKRYILSITLVLDKGKEAYDKGSELEVVKLQVA